MSLGVEQQIIVAEERLRLAMLRSDLEVLDELISPDLIFTNHMGQVFSKHDDLDMHRSGALKLYTLEPSENRYKVYEQFAVTLVRMKLSGIYNSLPFAADLRYTRIWHLSVQKTWQIVAGHISAVQA